MRVSDLQGLFDYRYWANKKARRMPEDTAFKMKLRLQTAIRLGLIVVGISACGRDATAPQALNVAGTWTGTESDRLGPALLTWTLSQTGTVVWGTAEMRPVDAADGSCASCHKSKIGNVTGTVSGWTITLTMFFPAGGQGDPTPACSIRLNGGNARVTAAGISGTYAGSDPCEGTFDGTMTLARKPDS